MGFVVLPALIPDISAVYDVYFAAFKNNPITRALFPSATVADFTDAKSEFRQGHAAHVSEYWKTSSTQYTYKCIDSKTNRIVGVALFDVYIAPSDWEKGEISWLAGAERERAEAYIMPLWSMREKLWLNERYVYCHVMAVHPEFQRRGVGELIFKFGMAIAEQAGLPMYIESSKEGRRLYEKMECKRLEDKLVDENGQEAPLFVWMAEGVSLPKAVKLA
ncbi:Acyl- N-acyltransferase [Pyrenophora seminiperda CCB06]|uniref:Acyl-N-acyltransferase n=1 Tax=Pyrenophora seminiperda CCB06 TaxID=1302712 RepID=A0A3M7MIZ4_9PLEO|nr:Acyl- N-acyltransferase [Pyrenophora seminiperda CCB06]